MTWTYTLLCVLFADETHCQNQYVHDKAIVAIIYARQLDASLHLLCTVSHAAAMMVMDLYHLPNMT